MARQIAAASSRGSPPLGMSLTTVRGRTRDAFSFSKATFPGREASSAPPAIQSKTRPLESSMITVGNARTPCREARNSRPSSPQSSRAGRDGIVTI